MEQSVVKDSKSRKGGIIGCSRENTATAKWYLTVQEGAAIVRNLKRMCGFNDYEEIIHCDMVPLAVKESEKNVQKIISVITGRFGNPFQFEPENDEISPLIDIASGIVFQADVAGAFLIAKETGREAMIDFAGRRINSNSETLDKKITQLQLPTFSNVPRGKTKEKGNDKTRSQQTDRALFGRLIVISQQRKVDLRELFAYELASAAMALTNSDGSLSKTNKVQVMHVLEEHGNPSKDPELFAQVYVNDKENTGVFIDHMGVVQKC